MKIRAVSVSIVVVNGFKADGNTTDGACYDPSYLSGFLGSKWKKRLLFTYKWAVEIMSFL